MAPWDVLSEEQRELRDLVRTLARERVAPRAAEIDRVARVPVGRRRAVPRARALPAASSTRRSGGTGTGTLLALVAIEEISKVCATSGLILAVQELGSLGLKLAGTPAQKERYLPRLATGEWLAAYALTEAGSGSDSAAMRTTARRDGDGFVLDGTKRFITNAASPGCTRCSRRPIPTRATRASRRSSSRPTTPGFEVDAARAEDGHPRVDDRRAASSTACGSRQANRLGDEGTGFTLAMRILDRSRPGVAAQALGIAQGATDYALEYARTRETMGKPIAEHQLIAAKLADMETRLRGRARRALPVRADGRRGRPGGRADEGLGDGEARLRGRGDVRSRPRRCRSSAATATSRSTRSSGCMRDAKITQIYEGTKEIQRLVIAREMLRESRG